MEKKTDKKKTEHFKSEFNMGEQHFKRWNDILEALDYHSVRIGLFNRESLQFLQPYWSLLQTLFINISPIIDHDVDEDYQDRFIIILKEIQTPKTEGKKINIHTHLELLKLHKDLCYLMQIKGLGIWAVRDISETEKIRNRLGIGKKKE